MTQTQFVFSSPSDPSTDLALQCPAPSCRQRFAVNVQHLRYSGTTPFAKCPHCRCGFEVKAHGKHDYHTLLTGNL